MFDTWLFLLFLQVALFPTAQAASLLSPSQLAIVTLTESTNLTTADHASILLPNPSNELSLFFTNQGDSIPAAELRHTLSVASANVQYYLLHHANEPISDNFFETNCSFPETRDRVYISVHAYGFGLSWLQLRYVLVMLQGYMFGEGPGHPHAHNQQLEFYVQQTAGIEVAHGVVEFTPGARAVAKRDLLTTTLQLPQANVSSLSTPTLPITFRIPKTNLDLSITSLGDPIPQWTILSTIEEAFADIILNHDDIESPIPANQPYSFNVTFGHRPNLFITKIQIAPYRGKPMSWGLLCIVIYGLRDFMQATKHFNATGFEILDAKLGGIGRGDVLYWPLVNTASTERLKLE